MPTFGSSDPQAGQGFRCLYCHIVAGTDRFIVEEPEQKLIKPRNVVWPKVDVSLFWEM